MKIKKPEWNTVEGMELIDGKWKYWSHSTKGIEEKGVIVEDRGPYYSVSVFAHDKRADFKLPRGACKQVEFEAVHMIAEYYKKDPESFIMGLDGQKRYNNLVEKVNAGRTIDNWEN